MAGAESVLEYLGRYPHRVAISNGRLLRMDARTVTFRYKDYRQNGALKEMTLPGVEFVRRLALHVFPSGLTKIRYYGILGNKRRPKLVPLARETLTKSRWRLELAPVSKPAVIAAVETSGCLDCGSENLICVGRLAASGDFPFGSPRRSSFPIGKPLRPRLGPSPMLDIFPRLWFHGGHLINLPHLVIGGPLAHLFAVRKVS